MKKETKLIILLIALAFAVLIGLIAFFHADNFINLASQGRLKQICVLVEIVLSGTWLKLLRNYFKIKKLEYTLSTEMGFIARAIFYTLSSKEEINTAELKEAFAVTNAIVHTVGSDIALLDKCTSQNILEFYSLLKVVVNTLSLTDLNRKEKLLHLFRNLTEKVNLNKQAKEIVENSWHARMGFFKAEHEEVNLG